jgi:superfamily II RNA helicase
MQMAGRAGRRGLDAVGIVVIAAWDEPPGEQPGGEEAVRRGRTLKNPSTWESYHVN